MNINIQDFFMINLLTKFFNNSQEVRKESFKLKKFDNNFKENI